MYFNKKIDTDMNKEFDNKKFDKNKLKIILIFLFSLILLVIGIVLLFGNNGKEKISYNLLLDGERLITIYKDNEFIDPGCRGYDSLGNDLSEEITFSSNLDTSVEGDYQIIYKLYDQEVIRYISVIDTPEGITSIYLKGDLLIYLNVGEKYEEPGYIVIDSIDSTLSDKVNINSNVDTNKAGVYKVVYSVTNSTGVMTQAKRDVIVIDSEITLSIGNNEWTNGNVSLNVYINDIYFDYLVLPNGEKVKEKKYSYQISSNGTYKFVSYNRTGHSVEKSITVTNIDKEVPSGKCMGSYGGGITSIKVYANDNVGISKYEIEGKSYTSNEITINKDMSKASVVIYDKAGNTSSVSCDLTKKYDLEIHFINVGREDAIFIRSNEASIFIDGGSIGKKNTIVSYLQNLGVKKIDAVIGSHLHYNHIQAQAGLIENFTVDKLYYSHDLHTCVKDLLCEERDVKYILDDIDAYGKKISIMKEGDNISIGDLNIKVIAPLDFQYMTYNPYAQNYNSLNFIVTYGNNKFMFTGDNVQSSKILSKYSKTELDVDLFKYPHHGNATVSNEMIQALSPEYVIVTSSQNVQLNCQSTIQNLGGKIYYSGSSGNILTTSDGNKVSIKTNINPSYYKR